MIQEDRYAISNHGGTGYLNIKYGTTQLYKEIYIYLI